MIDFSGGFLIFQGSGNRTKRGGFLIPQGSGNRGKLRRFPNIPRIRKPHETRRFPNTTRIRKPRVSAGNDRFLGLFLMHQMNKYRSAECTRCKPHTTDEALFRRTTQETRKTIDFSGGFLIFQGSGNRGSRLISQTVAHASDEHLPFGRMHQMQTTRDKTLS